MLQIRTGQCCRRASLSSRQWSDRCPSHDSAVAHMTKRITHSSPLPQSCITTTNPAVDRRVFSHCARCLEDTALAYQTKPCMHVCRASSPRCDLFLDAPERDIRQIGRRHYRRLPIHQPRQWTLFVQKYLENN